MPITDFAELESKLRNSPRTPLSKSGANTGTTLDSFGSSWTRTPESGTVPSAAVACNNSTVGAMLSDYLLNSYTAERYLARAVVNTGINTPGAGQGQTGLLIDRLSHQGGLSAIVTTEQTTNLPTAALTRYSGTASRGNMIGIEIYTAIGSTATTLTARYTNQDGTASQVTKPVVFGGTPSNNNAVTRFFVLPLADGDTGVRSVEGVTVLATTGTAGNFGVVIFRPLVWLCAPVAVGNFFQASPEYAGLVGLHAMPRIENNACLSLLFSNGNIGANLMGEFHFVDA